MKRTLCSRDVKSGLLHILMMLFTAKLGRQSLTLETIHAAGLFLNVVKCNWVQQETSCLGYRLGNGELRSQVDKLEVIR